MFCARCAREYVLLPEGSGALLRGRAGFTAREGTQPRARIWFWSKRSEFAQRNESGGGDGPPSFNEINPLFRSIREMILVRKQNQLCNGAFNCVRYADENPVSSRVPGIDRVRSGGNVSVSTIQCDGRRRNISLSSAGNWERVFASGAKEVTLVRPRQTSYCRASAVVDLVLRNPQPDRGWEGTDPASCILTEPNLWSTGDGKSGGLRPRQRLSGPRWCGVKGETDYNFLGRRGFASLSSVADLGRGSSITGSPEFKAVAPAIIRRVNTADVSGSEEGPAQNPTE